MLNEKNSSVPLRDNVPTLYNTTIANTAATTTNTNNESNNLVFFCLGLFKKALLFRQEKNT